MRGLFRSIGRENLKTLLAFAVLTGNNTCKKRHKRCEQLVKFVIRLFTAVIPISAAFGVSNLVHVLQ